MKFNIRSANYYDYRDAEKLIKNYPCLKNYRL